jgi:hypothetical protein
MIVSRVASVLLALGLLVGSAGLASDALAANAVAKSKAQAPGGTKVAVLEVTIACGALAVPGVALAQVTEAVVSITAVKASKAEVGRQIVVRLEGLT